MKKQVKPTAKELALIKKLRKKLPLILDNFENTNIKNNWSGCFSEKEKFCFVEHYVNKTSYSEISTMLGVTKQYVGYLTNRCKKKIKIITSKGVSKEEVINYILGKTENNLVKIISVNEKEKTAMLRGVYRKYAQYKYIIESCEDGVAVFKATEAEINRYYGGKVKVIVKLEENNTFPKKPVPYELVVL